MKYILLLCAVELMLGSGCMSARVITDLKPDQSSSLKTAAGTFYIANLQFRGSNPQTTQYYGKFQQPLLSLLRKECAQRYPGLFVNNSSSAISLGVDVESTTTMHNGKMMGWMYGTLLISGLIFPCPSDSDEDLDVRAFVWNGQNGLHSGALEKTFRRKSHVWVSLLTPSALITIPGESDFPKITGTLFSLQRMEDDYLQQIAPQIATALAKMVTAKDASYWTTQPQVLYSPMLNTPAGDTSSPPPSTLPLPTETVSPF